MTVLLRAQSGLHVSFLTLWAGKTELWSQTMTTTFGELISILNRPVSRPMRMFERLAEGV